MFYKQGEVIPFTVKNNKKIYCAASLFSPLDRVGAAHPAYFIEKEISDYITRNDLQCKSDNFVFLPFRDSKQVNLSGKERSRQIYEKNIAELKNSSAIFTRIDGLVKDCGVAMEIGFAFALGIPVGVLLTDFIWEGSFSTNSEWQLDPILEHIVNCFQISHKLVQLKDAYYFSNKYLEEIAVYEFVKEYLSTICVENKFEAGTDEKRIYIDFVGGRFDWARERQQCIKNSVHSPSMKICTSERFLSTNVKSVETLKKKSLEDIQNAMNASIAVFSGDCLQIDFGSSILLGMCIALRKTVVLQYSSDVCYKGDGGQIMRVNLMIDQSVDYITKDVAATIQLLEKLTGKSNS